MHDNSCSLLERAIFIMIFHLTNENAENRSKEQCYKRNI